MFILDSDSVKKAKITLYLIIGNILIYIFLLPFQNTIYYFVQINGLIFTDFEIWRLFTAIFIHGDITHLLSNMFGLFLFGIFVESFYSKFKFIVIYLVSGIIGNVFSLFLLPIYVISFGASGAIFGLIGASLIVLLRERYTPLILIGLIYVLYFIVSSFLPGTNYFAHIFGLLGGLFLGYIFRKNKIKKNEFEYI